MTTIDIIRAEIERRRNNARDWSNKAKYKGPHYHKMRGIESAYDAILSFLSDLESENPMNQEGLEEEISRTYHNGSVADTSDMDHVDYENIARHFAEWQKEQMIKDAFEAIISQCPGSNEIIFHNPISVHSWEFPWKFSAKGLNKGDKVRIIIVKD